MLNCKWLRKLVFSGALAVASPALAGDPAPAPQLAPSIEAVLKRLEETEARLKSVEAELKATPTLLDQAPMGAGAVAQDGKPAVPTLDSRIKVLESDLAKSKSDSKKREEDAAKRPGVKVSGRLHMDAYFFPRSDDLIDAIENDTDDNPADPQAHYMVRRARIAVEGDILTNMMYKIEMEFASPRAPVFRDLYIGWKNLPLNHTVFVGNHKKPLGLESLTSSRYLTFLERSLVDEITNPDQRRPGISAWGHNDCQSVGWAFGVFGLQDWNRRLELDNSGEFYGNAPQHTFNARVHTSPWYDEASGGRGYLHLAVAGQYADPVEDFGDVNFNGGYGLRNETQFRTRPELRSLERWIDTARIGDAFQYNILAFEAATAYGSFHASGEYHYVSVDRVGSGTDNDPNFHAYYGQVGWFITGEHRPYTRGRGTFDRVTPHQNFFLVERCTGGTGSGWGAWELAARYSVGDLTDQTVVDPIRGGVQRNITLGLNWYLNPYAKIQFNWVNGKIDSLDDRTITRPGAADVTTNEGRFSGFATRLAIDF